MRNIDYKKVDKIFETCSQQWKTNMTERREDPKLGFSGFHFEFACIIFGRVYSWLLILYVIIVGRVKLQLNFTLQFLGIYKHLIFAIALLYHKRFPLDV